MSTKSSKLAEMPTGYNVAIVGRHVAVTEAMKAYAMEKLEKIERLSQRIIDVTVTMDIQKLEHRVSIVMRVYHWKIKVEAYCADMYAAIDKAIDRLQAKVRRFKARIQEHQARGLNSIDMNVNVISRVIDDLEEFNTEIEGENLRQVEEVYRPHHVVAKESRPLKVLTIKEASIKMDLSGDQFLIFRCQEDMRLKVIYRREDGHFGVIEIE